jgi:NAD(P)-dependent dehydrogenase (short-subunit alcohol dehydrogenase family)
MAETIMRRNWLITGVSSGIGRSLAEGALAEGHVVVGTVRKPEQIGEFEKLFPGRAKAVMLDVTKADGVVSGVGAAAKALGGRIDVLVNNAGWGLVGAIEETSEEEARDVFEVNSFGQLNVPLSNACACEATKLEVRHCLRLHTKSVGHLPRR